MTRKTATQLLAQSASSFPDNSLGSITPALLRTMVNDFIDSVKPATCAIQLTTASPALTTTDAGWTWTSTTLADSPEYTAPTLVGGIVNAALPCTVAIDFTIDVAIAATRLVTFTLYVDGIITPWAISVQGSGATNPDSVTLSAFATSANASPVFQIRAKVDTAATPTLTNGAFLTRFVMQR